MDARASGPLEGLPGTLNVLRATPRQSPNHGPADLLRHGLYGAEFAVRGNGKSRLDHVHTQAVELMRHAQLLISIHAAARRLFPVTQRRVEYLYALSFKQVTPPGEKA